jgi:restriction system protein
MSKVTTKTELAALVRAAYPGVQPGAIPNKTGQLWALTNRMEVNDLVVLPLKTTGQLAIGRVDGGYEYRDDPDPTRRHFRRVKWMRTDVPRVAVKQDLLRNQSGGIGGREPRSVDEEHPQHIESVLAL